MTALRSLLAAASSMALAACAGVGPNYAEPDLTGLASGDLSGDPAAPVSAEEPAQAWWTTLGDPALTGLVEEAFAANRDLRVAAANVEAARAILSANRTALRPVGEGSAEYQRRRLSGAAFGAEGERFPDTDYFELGFGASWELDFFGRVRRSVEAARADAQSADWLRRDAEALVAAETARAYFDYRGAALRLAVARRNLEVQRETRALTQARLEEGMGSRLDVARAEAQARSTEAMIPPLEALSAAAVYRLATLTAQPARAVEEKLARGHARLPEPPAALAVGDVESLLRRRADVRAAERALAAATARIGVATADYFPRVTLVGAVTASAQTLSGVGADGSFGYGAGPSLVWSGFDIPRVRAGVRAAGARAEAALAAYEQAVLVALEETQGALVDYGRERARLSSLDEAAAHAREAAELARERYDGGVDDFLDVLDAETRRLAAEAALAESAAAAASKYAAVWLALGAGWRAETPKDGADV